MGRKKFTHSEEQLRGDSRYNSRLVSKFVNCLMYDGKKSVASRVFYDAMEIIGKKVKDAQPIEVFETALQNVKPNIEVRSKRVGGSNYQVPIQVNRKRQQSLAIRWLLEASRGRKGSRMCENLAKELIDAYHREGTAMTTRENVHRMAEANKAFSHFAW
ncbi:MAG TPA: 30S ribosomal protein S7 [Phycisphaerae bacterium]|nr:30S ribosomal protein S7 [Phycisphaerae bacterium]HRY68122.1 30S ribosomal protein S7 [Phycisphaerae bacterium]HSA28795.1 30S ribosomal protein S7 [Phycisphaerae bacterium]